MEADNHPPGDHYQALIELLRTSEAIWESSRLFFAGWDISPSQFNVLNLLRDHPEGCSQTRLSEQLIMHRSNVTGLIDRLEARKLVERLDNPADRRAFCVRLTREGKKLLGQILPQYYAAAEKVWTGLDTARATTLIHDLKTLSQNAQQIAGQTHAAPKPRKSN